MRGLLLGGGEWRPASEPVIFLEVGDERIKFAIGRILNQDGTGSRSTIGKGLQVPGSGTPGRCQDQEAES